MFVIFFYKFTQEEEIKAPTGNGNGTGIGGGAPSISIPHIVWDSAATSLSDAPWLRGRAAKFAEVSVIVCKNQIVFNKFNLINGINFLILKLIIT